MNPYASSKKALWVVFLVLAVVLCGCAKLPEGETTEPNPHIDLKNLVFSYTELNYPETLSTADHLFCCYQSPSQTLLSVCSENGREIGPTQKTDLFALCGMDGSMTTFSIETDAYITSALPYQDGVLYTDYRELSDGSVEWSVKLTTASGSKVLDNGSALAYDRVPYLFFVQDQPYYLCENQDGFQIRQITDRSPKTVHTETGCTLVGAEVSSNGKQYCFLAQYPDEEFCRFLVFDEDGLQYRHTLSGKITSYTITDRYAVCGSSNEDTKICSVEAVDLSTGTAKVFTQPFGALWCLSGSGSICVCVDYSWQPYALDVEAEQICAISGPKSSTNKSTPLLCYPAGESRFFALSQQKTGYAFYLLTASPA